MPHPATTPDPRPALAIDALRAARFHVRRKGYDIAEVDRLLQRCLQTLERSSAPADGQPGGEGERAWRTFWDDDGEHAARPDDDEVVALISATRLPVRRKGYDLDEVDALLAQLAAIVAGPIVAVDAAPAAAPSPVAPAPPAPGAAVAPGHEGIARPGTLGTISDGADEPGAVAGRPLSFGPLPSAPSEPARATLLPPPAAAEPVIPPVVEPVRREGLEDRLVQQVVDASLQTAHELADGPGLRREAERLLEQLHEARLAEIGAKVERECRDLRSAAVDQCAAVVADARAEADRMLATVSRQVEERLEQVRRDATEELERIVAEERRGLAEAAAASAPDASVAAALGLAPSALRPADRPLVFAEPPSDGPVGPVGPVGAEPGPGSAVDRRRTSLPRRPQIDLPFTTREWDLASVDGHGDRRPSSYRDGHAPTAGAASDVEDFRS